MLRGHHVSEHISLLSLGTFSILLLQNSLRYEVEGKLSIGDNVLIDTIEILGVNTSVSTVTLEDKPAMTLSYKQDVTMKVCTVSTLWSAPLPWKTNQQ